MKDAISKAREPLADIQSSKDERKIDIDKVGVRGIQYPIRVLDRANEVQHTIGNFTLTVDLPHEFRGTHMSRFLEVLNANRKEVSVQSIPKILEGLRSRLNAERAHLDVTFPFFIAKAAPVTGKVGSMVYTCGFSAESNGDYDLEMLVIAPVTTLCPCSKEISARGAHNQRGYVTLKCRSQDHIWLEELIELIEDAASCDLYPILKRPDEKWVTEKAYDNPRFVEDMVREIALRLDSDTRIVSYETEVENHESIHAHNAYAYLKRDRKG